MSDQYWGWILSIIGLVGFYLAGKKVWWCWYVNIANQVLWAAYALITDQLGFLLGTAGYLFVFVKNAYTWTRDRHKPELNRVVGRVLSMEAKADGLYVTGEIHDDETMKLIQGDVIQGFSLAPNTKITKENT